MTSTDTATVKTLTAEVRTLVIGNRQVTMSVFNQLDWIEPLSIEPMGRVRAKDPAQVWIIGRNIRDGSLARSREQTFERQAMAYERGRYADRLLDPFYGNRDDAARIERWQRCAEGVAATEAGQRAREWEKLPLLVLAGLR